MNEPLLRIREEISPEEFRHHQAIRLAEHVSDLVLCIPVAHIIFIH